LIEDGRTWRSFLTAEARATAVLLCGKNLHKKIPE